MNVPTAQGVHRGSNLIHDGGHILVSLHAEHLTHPTSQGSALHRHNLDRVLHGPKLRHFRLTGKPVLRYKHRMARKRNPQFDALAILDSPDLSELTSPSRVAKALAVIKGVCPNVTAEEIVRRTRNLQLHWPRVTIKSTTLAYNWGRAANPPAPRQETEKERKMRAEISKLESEIGTSVDPGYTAYVRARIDEIKASL